jgi:hypothetical protein
MRDAASGHHHSFFLPRAVGLGSLSWGRNHRGQLAIGGDDFVATRPRAVLHPPDMFGVRVDGSGLSGGERSEDEARTPPPGLCQPSTPHGMCDRGHD